MSSVKIKTIDFNKGSIGSKDFELSNLDIESAKSVAYVVRWQLARKRSGSAKVKSMSEISGTTAKPHKQKGTGRARQGSKRSVQFVGGRTCHGPTPRSFDFTMPKKILKIALSDAIKLKLQQDKLATFSDFGSDVKTSKINSALKSNNVSSALIIHDGSSEALVKSARNLKNVKVLRDSAVNVYDILNFDHLFIDGKIFESKILGAVL
jgi:large subunit ribosomal protein L4